MIMVSMVNIINKASSGIKDEKGKASDMVNEGIQNEEEGKKDKVLIQECA